VLNLQATLMMGLRPTAPWAVLVFVGRLPEPLTCEIANYFAFDQTSFQTPVDNCPD